MKCVAVLALLTTGAVEPIALPAKGSVEQRAAYEQGQANQAD